MKNTALITISLACFTWFNLVAQIGGNHITEHYNSNHHQTVRNNPKTVSMYTTDSTLVVNSKVLLNTQADHYMMHIGVSQFNKTVDEATQNINSRIHRVTKKLKGLNINKNDIYVDFISKIKVYDHSIIDNVIVEYFDGYRIQKNIIIKFNNLSDVDAILEYCALENIHDIIKVDYINNNIDQIRDQLISEADRIIEKKKNRYVKRSSIPLSKHYKVSNEKFQIFEPKHLYKKYNEAHETSQVRRDYHNQYSTKKVRKETTYYYDKISTTDVDKVIDPISPIVGIQYVLEVQMIYKFASNKH